MLPEPTDPRERVGVEAARVVARLQALGPNRAPADQVREACTGLARLAWRAEGLPGEPPPIDVAPHGWADVVRVLAADLRGATGPDADEALTEAADLLTQLRRDLP